MPHCDDRGGMKFQIANSLLFIICVGLAVCAAIASTGAIVAIIFYIACWLILLSASLVDG